MADPDKWLYPDRTSLDFDPQAFSEYTAADRAFYRMRQIERNTMIGKRQGALTITGERKWHDRLAYTIACDCGRSCLMFADHWNTTPVLSCGQIVLPDEEMKWPYTDCLCEVCVRRRREMFAKLAPAASVVVPIQGQEPMPEGIGESYVLEEDRDDFSFSYRVSEDGISITINERNPVG